MGTGRRHVDRNVGRAPQGRRAGEGETSWSDFIAPGQGTKSKKMVRMGNDNYEVQMMRDGRWVTEAARDRQSSAMELAEKFLARSDCEGVRIIANKTHRDGTIDESVVFEKTQAVSGDKPIRINPIEETPPYCKTTRDIFGLESRMILNRIFRTYLESVMLTPTEVLHGHGDLVRLCDRDSLLPSSVNLAAKLQTQGTDRSARDRQDELYGLVEQITAQARRADALDLPRLRQRFSSTLKAVSRVEGETAEYLAMAVLAKELGGIRSWIGKLDKLCELAAAEEDRKAVLLLDTVIADVLGANVIQELLGWQKSLGSAIIAMLDLADGKFDTEQSDAQETAEALNGLFAGEALPASRHVLIDRAIRQLKSTQPLYRSEPDQELREYQRVLARLLVPGGILSGAKAAEAITVRGARFVEQGGATGRKAAITNTVKVLPDKARGVMYLAELSNTDFLDDHADDIVEQLDNVFSARVIDELCRRSMSPKNRMVTATGAHQATLSSKLPDEVKNRVAAHIDGVLERYLVDENIIEKLDNPDTHLRDRAVRLVKFCGAGVLPEGKAMTLARQRIVTMLRQPNFDQHFVEGLADAESAAAALRGFHKLLVKAGFAEGAAAQPLPLTCSARASTLRACFRCGMSSILPSRPTVPRPGLASKISTTRWA